jgi:peptidoglycan/xylan/chitin deacetylase (PgdA/CDA1 family)
MIACLTFDVDAEAPILAESGLYAQNLGVMSHQAYGPLVGVPRILELLREYSLSATFFVPGWTADRYPQTVEAILAAGHEVGHHSYAHHSPFAQSEDEERADFERALDALRRAGAEPVADAADRRRARPPL